MKKEAKQWRARIEQIRREVFELRKTVIVPTDPSDEAGPIPEEHEGGLIRLEGSLLESIKCLNEILAMPTTGEGDPDS